MNNFEDHVTRAVQLQKRPPTRADVRRAFVKFLTALRRKVAGDSPSSRPPGSLEHFDAACDALGVPFLEP